MLEFHIQFIEQTALHIRHNHKSMTRVDIVMIIRNMNEGHRVLYLLQGLWPWSRDETRAVLRINYGSRQRIRPTNFLILRPTNGVQLAPV
jgi:hypothetical protein